MDEIQLVMLKLVLLAHTITVLRKVNEQMNVEMAKPLSQCLLLIEMMEIPLQAMDAALVVQQKQAGFVQEEQILSLTIVKMIVEMELQQTQQLGIETMEEILQEMDDQIHEQQKQDGPEHQEVRLHQVTDKMNEEMEKWQIQLFHPPTEMMEIPLKVMDVAQAVQLKLAGYVQVQHRLIQILEKMTVATEQQ